MKDRASRRRRSRSEDLYTPRRHVSNALVPVSSTRHAAEESSDRLEVDDERLDDNELEGSVSNRSRDRRIRKWMHPYPLSRFRKSDRQRKRYRMTSKFVKEEWRSMRETPLLIPAETLFSMRYRNHCFPFSVK